MGSLELLLVAALQAVFNQGQFLLGLADPLLLVDQESISIFQCIFCSSLEGKHDLRPLLLPVVTLDQGEQLDVLLSKPRPLLQLGIQEAVPVLSALLGASEDLGVVVVEEVEFLSDEFPVEIGKLIHQLAMELLLMYDFSEEVALMLVPAAGGEVDLPDAEPLEHAAIGSNSWDELRNPLPIFKGDIFVDIGNDILVAVLGDHPDEYLHVLLAPVLLDLLVLDHLLDSRGDDAQDGLIADVGGDHLLVSIDLLAVLQDVASDVALPVLLQLADEEDEFLLGLGEGRGGVAGLLDLGGVTGIDL